MMTSTTLTLNCVGAGVLEDDLIANLRGELTCTLGAREYILGEYLVVSPF